MLNNALLRCLQEGGDLRINPSIECAYLVIEGDEQEIHEIPDQWVRPLEARLMIMADLDPVQTMLDQSGEFQLDIGDQAIQVKAQTTAHGVGQVVDVEMIRVPSGPPLE